MSLVHDQEVVEAFGAHGLTNRSAWALALGVR